MKNWISQSCTTNNIDNNNNDTPIRISNKKKLLSFLDRYHLILMLSLAMILAFSIHDQLPQSLSGGSGSNTTTTTTNNGILLISPSTYVWNTFNSIAVSIIFLFSGFTLKTNEVKTFCHLSNIKPFLVGMILMLIVTPCLGFLLATTYDHNTGLKLGIALFPLMPTTLSSGVIIVNMANGATVLALLFTLTSSLVGIGFLAFTIPQLIQVMNVQIDGKLVTIPATSIVLSLIFSLLIPLVIGKCIREISSKGAKIIDKNKVWIKYSSSFLISMISFVQLDNVSQNFNKIDSMEIIMAILTAMSLHICLWVICIIAVRIIFSDNKQIPEQKAIVIMGAQKSLPVALLILTSLNDLGLRNLTGVATLPLVLAHFWQTLMDSFYASRIVDRDVLGRKIGVVVVAMTDNVVVVVGIAPENLTSDEIENNINV
jgi:sodium/bile acid cotransporter 7